jgi:hypothetical protein
MNRKKRLFIFIERQSHIMIEHHSKFYAHMIGTSSAAAIKIERKKCKKFSKFFSPIGEVWVLDFFERCAANAATTRSSPNCTGL